MFLFTSGPKPLFFTIGCVFITFFSAFLCLGCTQKEENIFIEEAAMQTLDPTVKGLFPTNPPPPSGCDTTLLPVVMVHGFLAAGDTYAPFLMRFHSNGYCLNRLFAFDWNSISGTNTVAALDAFIDNVLAETGATQVNLMGHSAGGGTCYEYLADATHAAKVAHYVHIGSSIQTGPAGPSGSVSTMNIWSPGDLIAGGGDISGAINVMNEAQDHYQVATSKESFGAIYEFFNDIAPFTVDILEEEIVCIAGKSLTFGENQPVVNGTVEIYTLDPATGNRLSAVPDYTFTTDASGNWGPLNLPALTPFEFLIIPTSGRKVHYFRQGFHHSNSLVYLRALPPPGSIVGILLGSLPNSANQTVLNVFSASQAIVYQRDSLTVDGLNLANAQYADPAKTAITYFLYDNGNSQTDGTPVGLFGNFPFMNGVDMFFSPPTLTPVPIYFNGAILNIRKIPSDEGVVVAVMD